MDFEIYALSTLYFLGCARCQFFHIRGCGFLTSTPADSDADVCSKYIF